MALHHANCIKTRLKTFACFNLILLVLPLSMYHNFKYFHCKVKVLRFVTVFYGFKVNVFYGPGFLTIANKYNIPVIEDAAQSVGSLYQNTPSGSFGKIESVTSGSFTIFISLNTKAIKSSKIKKITCVFAN